MNLDQVHSQVILSQVILRSCDMKSRAKTLLPFLLAFLSVTVLARSKPERPKPTGFPPQITHVVVIFQENRTPDNLFHFLTPACPLPSNADELKACIPASVTSSCYDISPCGVSNETGSLVTVPLKPVPLAGSVDPDHSH